MILPQHKRGIAAGKAKRAKAQARWDKKARDFDRGWANEHEMFFWFVAVDRYSTSEIAEICKENYQTVYQRIKPYGLRPVSKWDLAERIKCEYYSDCGTWFKPNSPEHKICKSLVCRKRSRREYQRKKQKAAERKPGTCPDCGKPKGAWNKSKTCSACKVKRRGE